MAQSSWAWVLASIWVSWHWLDKNFIRWSTIWIDQGRLCWDIFLFLWDLLVYQVYEVWMTDITAFHILSNLLLWLAFFSIPARGHFEQPTMSIFRLFLFQVFCLTLVTILWEVVYSHLNCSTNSCEYAHLLIDSHKFSVTKNMSAVECLCWFLNLLAYFTPPLISVWATFLLGVTRALLEHTHWTGCDCRSEPYNIMWIRHAICCQKMYFMPLLTICCAWILW